MAAVDRDVEVKKLLNSFIFADTNDSGVKDSANPAKDNETGNNRDIKPRSRQAFLERVRTFTPMNWFAKPLWLSPLVCARYGWKNTGIDCLHCVDCGKYISGRLPSSSNPTVYDECCRQVTNSLTTGHISACPWANCPSPRHFMRIADNTSQTALQMFKQRLSQLLLMKDRLPIVTDETMGSINITSEHLSRLADVCDHSEDSDVLKSSMVLALTGWSTSTRGDFPNATVSCSICNRHVGLWNVLSVANPEPDEEEEEMEETRDVPIVDSVEMPNSTAVLNSNVNIHETARLETTQQHSAMEEDKENHLNSMQGDPGQSTDNNTLDDNKVDCIPVDTTSTHQKVESEELNESGGSENFTLFLPNTDEAASEAESVINKGVTEMVSETESVNKGVTEMVSETESVNKGMTEMVSETESENKGVIEMVAETENVNKGMTEMVSETESENKGVIEMVAETENVNKGVTEMVSETESENKGVIEMVAETENVNKGVTEMVSETGNLNSGVTEIRSEIANISNQGIPETEVHEESEKNDFVSLSQTSSVQEETTQDTDDKVEKDNIKIDAHGDSQKVPEIISENLDSDKDEKQCPDQNSEVEKIAVSMCSPQKSSSNEGDSLYNLESSGKSPAPQESVSMKDESPLMTMATGTIDVSNGAKHVDEMDGIRPCTPVKRPVVEEEDTAQPSAKKPRIQPKIQRSAFRPLMEHYTWCPWVSASQPEYESLPSTPSPTKQTPNTPDLPGWLHALYLLLPEFDPSLSNCIRMKANRTTPEALRSIRKLFNGWTTCDLYR